MGALVQQARLEQNGDENYNDAEDDPEFEREYSDGENDEERVNPAVRRGALQHD